MSKKEKVNAAYEALDGFTLGADVGPLIFVSTGHPQLDYAIAKGVIQDGVDKDALVGGGIPLGKMVELFGPEGGGKSSLAYRIVGNAQRMGLTCAWIDTEHSFSKQLAEINGVDVSSLMYADLIYVDDPDRIDDAEAILDKIVAVCKSGLVKVIVLDSVAFMSPKYTMEHDAEKMSVGALARALSTHLPKIANYAAKFGVLCVFINQLRDKIGVMYGDPESTPGGRALKHACSVRLRISKNNSKDALIEFENDAGEKEVIGCKARVTIKKNRFAPPVYDPIEIPIYYKFYFPNFIDHLFNVGRQVNVIKSKLGTYTYGSLKYEGRENFIENLKQNSACIDGLVDEIVEKAAEKEIALPPEILTYRKNRALNKCDQIIAVIEESLDNIESKKTSKKTSKKKTKKTAESEDASVPDELNDL